MSKKSFADGDVVWVKFGSCWWPAEVCGEDNAPEEFTNGKSKEKYIAIVRFFEENAFDTVKSARSICLYDCAKKMDYIKKGLALHRAKSPHSQDMENFPSAVQTAERLTNGDVDILESDALQVGPSKPTPVKTPTKAKAKPILARRKSGRLIATPSTPAITPKKAQTPSPAKPVGCYKCTKANCQFTSDRMSAFIAHFRGHGNPPLVSHSRVADTPPTPVFVPRGPLKLCDDVIVIPDDDDDDEEDGDDEESSASGVIDIEGESEETETEPSIGKENDKYEGYVVDWNLGPLSELIDLSKQPSKSILKRRSRQMAAQARRAAGKSPPKRVAEKANKNKNHCKAAEVASKLIKEIEDEWPDFEDPEQVQSARQEYESRQDKSKEPTRIDKDEIRWFKEKLAMGDHEPVEKPKIRNIPKKDRRRGIIEFGDGNEQEAGSSNSVNSSESQEKSKSPESGELEDEGGVLDTIKKLKEKYLTPDKGVDNAENQEKAENVEKHADASKPNDLEKLSADIDTLLNSTDAVALPSSSCSDEVRTLPIKERGKRIFKSRNTSKSPENSKTAPVAKKKDTEEVHDLTLDESDDSVVNMSIEESREHPSNGSRQQDPCPIANEVHSSPEVDKQDTQTPIDLDDDELEIIDCTVQSFIESISPDALESLSSEMYAEREAKANEARKALAAESSEKQVVNIAEDVANTSDKTENVLSEENSTLSKEDSENAGKDVAPEEEGEKNVPVKVRNDENIAQSDKTSDSQLEIIENNVSEPEKVEKEIVELDKVEKEIVEPEKIEKGIEKSENAETTAKNALSEAETPSKEVVADTPKTIVEEKAVEPAEAVAKVDEPPTPSPPTALVATIPISQTQTTTGLPPGRKRRSHMKYTPRKRVHPDLMNNDSSCSIPEVSEVRDKTHSPAMSPMIPPSPAMSPMLPPSPANSPALASSLDATPIARPSPVVTPVPRPSPVATPLPRSPPAASSMTPQKEDDDEPVPAKIARKEDDSDAIAKNEKKEMENFLVQEEVPTEPTGGEPNGDEESLPIENISNAQRSVETSVVDTMLVDTNNSQNSPTNLAKKAKEDEQNANKSSPKGRKTSPRACKTTKAAEETVKQVEKGKKGKEPKEGQEESLKITISLKGVNKSAKKSTGEHFLEAAITKKSSLRNSKVFKEFEEEKKSKTPKEIEGSSSKSAKKAEEKEKAMFSKQKQAKHAKRAKPGEEESPKSSKKSVTVFAASEVLLFPNEALKSERPLAVDKKSSKRLKKAENDDQKANPIENKEELNELNSAKEVTATPEMVGNGGKSAESVEKAAEESVIALPEVETNVKICSVEEETANVDKDSADVLESSNLSNTKEAEAILVEETIETASEEASLPKQDVEEEISVSKDTKEVEQKDISLFSKTELKEEAADSTNEQKESLTTSQKVQEHLNKILSSRKSSILEEFACFATPKDQDEDKKATANLKEHSAPKPAEENTLPARSDDCKKILKGRKQSVDVKKTVGNSPTPKEVADAKKLSIYEFEDETSQTFKEAEDARRNFGSQKAKGEETLKRSSDEQGDEPSPKYQKLKTAAKSKNEKSEDVCQKEEEQKAEPKSLTQQYEESFVEKYMKDSRIFEEKDEAPADKDGKSKLNEMRSFRPRRKTVCGTENVENQTTADGEGEGTSTNETNLKLNVAIKVANLNNQPNRFEARVPKKRKQTVEDDIPLFLIERSTPKTPEPAEPPPSTSAANCVPKAKVSKVESAGTQTVATGKAVPGSSQAILDINNMQILMGSEGAQNPVVVKKTQRAKKSPQQVIERHTLPAGTIIEKTKVPVRTPQPSQLVITNKGTIITKSSSPAAPAPRSGGLTITPILDPTGTRRIYGNNVLPRQPSPPPMRPSATQLAHQRNFVQQQQQILLQQQLLQQKRRGRPKKNAVLPAAATAPSAIASLSPLQQVEELPAAERLTTERPTADPFAGELVAGSRPSSTVVSPTQAPRPQLQTPSLAPPPLTRPPPAVVQRKKTGSTVGLPLRERDAPSTSAQTVPPPPQATPQPTPQPAVVSCDSAMGNEEQQIDENMSSKIMAVPTIQIPGYSETFLLCTVINGRYVPIDNKPMFLNHEMNQLVPIPQELIDPNLEITVRVSEGGEPQTSAANTSNSTSLVSSTTPDVPQREGGVSRRPRQPRHQSPEQLMPPPRLPSPQVQTPAAVVSPPPQLVQPEPIQAMEIDGSCAAVVDGESVEGVQQQFLESAQLPQSVIINIDGQQFVMDHQSFLELAATGEPTTLVTEDGLNIVLTPEMLASFDLECQPQLILNDDIAQANPDILAEALAGTEVYAADQIINPGELLQIETSQGLQLIAPVAGGDGIIYQPITPPTPALTSETNAVLNQTPIMSALEVPSTNGGPLVVTEPADLEDSLAVIGVSAQSSIIPSSLELPITVTNPAIASKPSASPLGLSSIYTTTGLPQASPISPQLSVIANEPELQYELFTAGCSGSGASTSASNGASASGSTYDDPTR